MFQLLVCSLLFLNTYRLPLTASPQSVTGWVAFIVYLAYLVLLVSLAGLTSKEEMLQTFQRKHPSFTQVSISKAVRSVGMRYAYAVSPTLVALQGEQAVAPPLARLSPPPLRCVPGPAPTSLCLSGFYLFTLPPNTVQC